jgi:hypothetical protein
MAQPCTICTRPDRDAIDHAIISGKTSYRAMARQYGVGREALARHHHAHVSPALVRVAQRRTERGEERQARRLLDRIEALVDRAEAILATAEESGAVAQALAAIRELRGLYELLGRATGELHDQPAVTVNLLASPEIRQYVVVVREELADLPERLARISERLALPEVTS